MESHAIIALASLLCLSTLYVDAATITTGTPDGMERWGYVEVRPKANLFWWYYKSAQRVLSTEKPWPTILWLQGGPGGSGVGRGNFLEIGPLDVDLNPRNSTWLQKADLIFVNIENIMIDNTMSSVASSSKATSPSPNTISDIMNGVIKKKLKIIPKDVIWQDASILVFDALSNDFMKPAINEVDELLSYGANVTVYNGQLDIICSTLGAEAWVKRLKWDGLHNFLSLPRKPLHYCHPYSLTNAFVRSYKNLHFYWVLGAGHMVPVDQPCTSLHMVSSIVHSPSN